MVTRHVLLAVALGIVLGHSIGAVAVASAADVRPKPECAAIIDSASVEDANKVIHGSVPGATPALAIDPKLVELKDPIAVKVSGLEKLYGKECDGLTLIPFLNGHPIKSLKPYPPTSPKDGVLLFVLARQEASRAAWTEILGRPGFEPRDVEVSVGFDELYPLKASTGKRLPVLKLNILQNRWFTIWLGVFLATLCAFFVLVVRSNVIRDGDPTAEGIAGTRGAYSLSKTQGAVWFFVILAAYLLIGLVTGDVSSSINATALILLGIGAGTVLGSAAIDASKRTPVEVEKQRVEIVKTQTWLAAYPALLESKLAEQRAAADPAARERAANELAALNAEKAQKDSFYRKLTGQGEHFIKDILSDANGINFHRFQIAVWTLVLAIIFIKDVYENLAMPTFNATLLGLLGLSAGTYLGLKIPEPTIPSA